MLSYIIFGLPIVSLIWFIVSLILYLRTPKEDMEKRRTRKILLSISAIVTLVLVLAIVGLILLFMAAIANM